MTCLTRYSWPGNVRELQNVIERAVILARSPVVTVDLQLSTTAAPPAESTANLLEVERRHILCVLESTRWRIYGPSGAAAQLGMNPSTLRSRMKKLGVTRAVKLPVST